MINENASADEAATDAGHPEQDQNPQQSAPPVRRRSRRATSAVTTPKHEEPVRAGSTDLPDTAATTASAGSEDAGPARADEASGGTTDAGTGRAKATGGRRKKAPAETAAPQDEASPDQPGSEEAAGPKKSGAKKSDPRKAGSTKAVRSARKAPRDQEPEPADTEAQGTHGDGAPAGRGSGRAGGERAGGEQAESTSPGSDEPEVASRPRLATTALLFQPPEPSRPRRRAQAPAGPPRPDETDEDEETADTSGQVTPDQVTPDQGDETSHIVAAEGADDDTEDDDAAEGDEDGADADGDGDGREGAPRRRRRRGGRGRRGRSGAGGSNGQSGTPEESDGDGEDGSATGEAEEATDEVDGGDSNGDVGEGSSSSRRRRRRRRGSRGDSSDGNGRSRSSRDEVTALKGSTRLEAKRQRRREGRDAGRRRTIVTESEFLARRESVERSMIVRESDGRVQIAVLEDGVLVEHFVSRSAQNGQASMAGNVYLGRVQNVLPSMEAAFIDVGKGRNAVLYAGEVNWDAAGMEGQPRRIEQALKSGDSVLVQVTKDPIGHKGARLTSQITLAGRYLVYVPGGGMTGISRKLPENERARLKKILREVVPDAAGVIVRTAAEGASEEELRNDVQRLQDQWAAIEKKSKTASAPALLQGEPDLAIRVVRDIFNDDFGSLVVQGEGAWSTISEYVQAMAPDLMEKVSRWDNDGDVFAEHRIDEQLAKGMDRKVWLPSGGSLVIDRTEAMTVVDVNTGKFTGSGGTLEETVTRNNLEAAEEIVRQLRLRDIGGIIVIDFIDMVLESNRDLVLRRLVECLGRDRTKHQVAEVTSLGLVQMTRKRVGQGLVEAFSEPCAHCHGRGFIVHGEPVDPKGSSGDDGGSDGPSKRSRRKKSGTSSSAGVPVLPEARESVKATLATIAAAAAQAHEHGAEPAVAVMPEVEAGAEAAVEPGADPGADDGTAADGSVPPATVDLPVGGEVTRPVPDHAALADLADSLRSVVAGREAAAGGEPSSEAAEEHRDTESADVAGEPGSPHQEDTRI